MKVLKNIRDNIFFNLETNFKPDLGREDALEQFENETVRTIINPVDNYETMRFIHKPYSGITSHSTDTQSDIWFYFYFYNQSGTHSGGLDYSLIGIDHQENAKQLIQTTKTFFRLEFFIVPDGENPDRTNRKLVFAKNLALPLGEKYYYTPLGGYVHLPVFKGSNYENKENMYFFWFQDESVLTETNLSGTTTGNTFFMTAKFYNAKNGSIVDFTNINKFSLICCGLIVFFFFSMFCFLGIFTQFVPSLHSLGNFLIDQL